MDALRVFAQMTNTTPSRMEIVWIGIAIAVGIVGIAGKWQMFAKVLGKS